jgi:hypothetical protein
MVGGIISTLFFLLFFGVLAYFILRGFGRSRKIITEPSCGRCGYSVAGLTMMTCPECGSDLRVVGIITPAMQFKQRGSPTVPILTWSFLVLIVGGMISSIVASSVAMVHHSNSKYTYMSRSSEYYTANLVMNGRSSEQWNLVADTCDIQLQLIDGRIVTMHVAGEQLTCEVGSGSSGGAKQLDSDVFLAWMESLGIDTSVQQVRDEAGELVMLVKAGFTSPMMTGPPATNALMMSGGGSSLWSSTPTWFSLTALVFWIVVWGVGVYLMVLGRRREMQRLGF